MTMYCPLASGSQGNCCFIKTSKVRLLLDAGLPAPEIERRLHTLGESLQSIDAILISHEHRDHIGGLPSIVKRHNIPVLANSATAQATLERVGGSIRFKIFTTGEQFEFHDTTIHPFTIQHDTLDPVAFVIKTPEAKLGFCTDLGFATTLVRQHLQGCHGLCIESNHDVDMVLRSRRPPYLQQRILGRQGHLSNEQCLELLRDIIHPGLRHIHLAHISQECNSPEKVLYLVRALLDHLKIFTDISIAHQDSVSQPVHFA